LKRVPQESDSSGPAGTTRKNEKRVALSNH
jgi:hypothetical protein